MINVVEYKAQHLAELRDKGDVGYLTNLYTDKVIGNLERFNSITVLSPEGEVISCGGVIPFWPTRGEAWQFFSERLLKKYALAVTRATIRFLEACPVRRIEAVVDLDFEQGHRYIQALGFEVEAPIMEFYGPTGKHCTLYSRIGG